MNRFILALLALLTGLAAQVSPAQARMCGVSEAEVGSIECTRSSPRATSSQGTSTEATARQDRPSREQPRIRPSAPRVFIPSVQFGADRAFE
ncbi:MAG TPA: hypothetical protein VHG29_11465 [Novosphingobium sp.]|nr:hypothetical protein [Novosphingobium sp.]